MMLLLVFALFVGSAVLVRWRDRRLRRKLRRLAVGNRLHYSAVDRFGLTERTRETWLSDCRPIDIKVRHVMYGREGERRRFVYGVEFQLGGASPRRVHRIIKAHEGADDSGAIPLDIDSIEAVNGNMIEAFGGALENGM